jgi:hypothetical protein
LLESVDCVSEDRCFAVGHYEAESVEERDIVAPLAGVWDGRAWTLQQPANTRTSFDTALKSVACPSAERCLAVGYVQLASGTYVPLTEAWDGVRWRMIAGPANPHASIYGELDGVSCVTPDGCTAVGYRLAPSGTSSSVAVSWDGSTWQTQTVPGIAGATNTALFAVDCPSTATCSSVGGYRRQTLVSVAFAAAWDGSAWSITAS